MQRSGVNQWRNKVDLCWIREGLVTGVKGMYRFLERWI